MIRRAVEKDVKRINELGSLVNEKFSILFDMNLIISEEVSKVFVYEEDDMILGFIHVTELHETVDIINIVVDPLYRNKKIATNLIDYMISDVDPEVNMITLEVAISNQVAIGLYEKFGFEIVNIRKSYYKNEDAYLMGRVIE